MAAKKKTTKGKSDSLSSKAIAFLRSVDAGILSMIYLMVVSTSGGYISPSLP